MEVFPTCRAPASCKRWLGGADLSLPATNHPSNDTTDDSGGRAQRGPRQDNRCSVFAYASAAQHESDNQAGSGPDNSVDADGSGCRAVGTRFMCRI